MFPRDNSFILPSYDIRCKIINLESLEKRRNNSYVFFMYDLLTSFIDAPNILKLINLYVPSHQLRGRDLIRVDFHRSDYGRNDPIFQMGIRFNNISDCFDFHVSRSVFRHRIKNH